MKLVCVLNPDAQVVSAEARFFVQAWVLNRDGHALQRCAVRCSGAARCSAPLQREALKRRVFGMRRSAEALSFLYPPLRAAALRCSAAAQGLNGQRCSAALQRQGKRQEHCLFSCLNSKNKTILMLFLTDFAADCCTAAAQRCSACVFELPLQRCAAAHVFFSTAAQRCSGEAQRCSGKALQR
jgi:hypothetical protein